MLAQAPAFPQPDSKVRTTSLTYIAGGNASNTATTARRLGLNVKLISRIGTDALGDAALSQLRFDGVDVSLVDVHAGTTTALAYVIVDAQNGTRTCITTAPDADLAREDVLGDAVLAAIERAELLVIDGRHPEAAIAAATYARSLQVPVLLDVERIRPMVDELLAVADYIVTNSTFPFDYAARDGVPGQVGKEHGEDSSRAALDDAMSNLLEATNARILITTRGAEGSTTMSGESLGCAERNAEVGKPVPHMTLRSHVSERTLRSYSILECAAWPAFDVVDTTGAGDAFIGGIVYGLVTKMKLEDTLALAAYVAAAEVAQVGARDGLPRREEVPRYLLKEEI